MLSRRSVILAAAVATAMAAWGPSARADNAADVHSFIQNLADTAMKTVAVKGLNDEERSQRFRSLFVNSFDLPEIGKLVLGRYWRVTTPEQQQEFLRLFEDVQVYTWARRFNDYSGETLDILSVTAEGDADAVVESRIKRDKQDPVAVSWRVRKSGDSFKVLDIKVEGASMALTHRSEYGSVIQAGGGQIEPLLVALRKKVAQLQAGGGQAPAAK